MNQSNSQNFTFSYTNNLGYRITVLRRKNLPDQYYNNGIGTTHQGFCEYPKPLVSIDRSVFQKTEKEKAALKVLRRTSTFANGL